MKTNLLILLMAIVACPAFAETAPEDALKGIELPKDFRQWRWVAPSYRTDKNSLRIIIANDIAWTAMQAGGKHFPDGAMIGKIAWKEKHHEKWGPAIVPSELQQIDFMQKGSKQFAATGGWGFSRWLGTGLKRDSKDLGGQECFACHSVVKDSDYTFTRPAIMPE